MRLSVEVFYKEKSHSGKYQSAVARLIASRLLERWDLEINFLLTHRYFCRH